MRKIIIGKVYAEWCGHCKNLKPEWSKMRKNLQSKMGKNNILEFVEIEESNNTAMDQFKERFPNLTVNGYPTIFKNTGEKDLEYYYGDRTADQMVAWALKPSISKISGGKKRKTLRKKSNNKTRKVKSKTSKK